MTWDDERIAQAMRAADPARSPLDEGKSPRAQVLLEHIVDGRRGRAGPRARLRLVARVGLSLAAVLVIALAVVTAVPLTTAPSYALTPQELDFRRNPDLTSQEVVDTSKDALSSTTSPTGAERGSRSVGWYLDSTITESGSTAVITPQVTTVTWGSDHAGSITVVAGHAYLATGSPSDGESPGGAPAPGTVLSTLTFAPGEYVPLAPDDPGNSPEDLQSFLKNYGLPAHYNAGDLMLAIGGAFGEWTLTNGQHAAILDLLAAASGTEILGTAVDRAGREVIGVRGNPSQVEGSAQLLLISTDTGRIVGAETILTSPVEKPQLDEGAVVSYTLWDSDEGNQDR